MVNPVRMVRTFRHRVAFVLVVSIGLWGVLSWYRVSQDYQSLLIAVDADEFQTNIARERVREIVLARKSGGIARGIFIYALRPYPEKIVFHFHSPNGYAKRLLAGHWYLKFM